MKNVTWNTLIGLILVLWLAACSAGGGTGSTGDSNTDTGDTGGTTTSSGIAASAAFPRTLAITSPAATGAASSAALRVQQGEGGEDERVLTYEEIVSNVDAILDVSQDLELSGVFSPEQIVGKGMDAECYGPELRFGTHPDGTKSSDELPVGDVGLWTESSTDGEACAAAQLNARISGVQDRVTGALTFMGVLLRVADDNGIAEPGVGEPAIEVDEELGALLATEISDPSKRPTITTASYQRLDATTVTYTLEYLMDPDLPASFIELTHQQADAEVENYQGFLYYRTTQTDDRQMNCKKADESQETAISYNGTLLYNVSGSDIKFESRYGGFCGSDVDARVSSTDKVLLDPSNAFNEGRGAEVANLDGWGMTFEVFAASFDAEGGAMSGDYVYTWQAGPNDRAGRSLYVNIASDGLSGDAFFGYTPDIVAYDQPTPGYPSLEEYTIGGVYCNWAGPAGAAFNTDSDYLRLGVQRQQMVRTSLDTSFTASQSNISYAPVHPRDESGEIDPSGVCESPTPGDGDVLELSGPNPDRSAPIATIVTNDPIVDNLVDLSVYTNAYSAPTAAVNPFE